MPGLTGELTVAAVSQLSLWLSENPSIESEVRIVPDRPLRAWSVGNGNNSTQPVI